uniref:DM13 domain-containing protein n=1 Tax=Parastrongyloides trichosuri TaxID=131310 RepID=A0A0N4Z050_PARTI
MCHHKLIYYNFFILPIILYLLLIVQGQGIYVIFLVDTGKQIKNTILPWSKYEKKYFAFHKTKHRDFIKGDDDSMKKIKLYLPPFKYAKEEHISLKDTFGGNNEFDSMRQNSVGSGGKIKVSDNDNNEEESYTPTFKYKAKIVTDSENTEINQGNFEKSSFSLTPSTNNRINGIGNAFPKRPLNIDSENHSSMSQKMKYEVEVPRAYFPKTPSEIPMLPKQIKSFNNMVPIPQNRINHITSPLVPPKQSSVTTFTDNHILPLDLKGLTNPFFNLSPPSQEIISPSLRGIEGNALENALSAVGQRFMPPSNLPIQPSGVSGPTNSLGAEAINMLLGGGNGGSPLENISKIARNFISMQSSNQDLLKLLSGALNNKNNELLTSNALFQTEKGKNSLKVSEEDTEPGTTEGEDLEEENIVTPSSSTLSSLKSNTSKMSSNVSITTTSLTSTMSPVSSTEATDPYLLLSSLPPEQREILQAAISSGELDVKNVLPTLDKNNNLLNASGKSNATNKFSLLKNNESKLLEWIQQNRPRVAQKMFNKKNSQSLSVDKLPYYGKYCGTLTETSTEKTNHNIAGALWAVDDRRFIVSKFHYRPGSVFENITFWAGPKNISNTITDAFPSTNGFYLKPKLVELSAFRMINGREIKAKIRTPIHPKPSEIVVTEYDGNETTIENILSSNIDDFVIHSKKDDEKNDDISTIRLSLNPSYNNASVSVENDSRKKGIHGVGLQLNSSIDSTSITSSSDKQILKESISNRDDTITSLEWYAGFQPLILELPDDKWVKTTNWVSIWDHKAETPIASVLIPNGPAFQIPSIVLLKNLSPVGSRKISSGPITILDTKTIEIKNFNLDTEGIPVWFMIGKDIIPNSNGLIVPTFDIKTKEYDCDSLRNYYNESVTLHLPESFEITDVFWFSVFSIPKSLSFSHIYLPYNDMHLPPHLMPANNPKCVYEKE